LEAANQKLEAANQKERLSKKQEAEITKKQNKRNLDIPTQSNMCIPPDDTLGGKQGYLPLMALQNTPSGNIFITVGCVLI